MEVRTHTAGGTSSTTTVHVDNRVASAAGVVRSNANRSIAAERSGVTGTSVGRVVRQPDGRYRAEVHVEGSRPRYFRSGGAARDHIISEVRSRAEARVGGSVPLAHSVSRGGAATARAAGRRAEAVTRARREGVAIPTRSR
jgi:hypothetical protein